MRSRSSRRLSVGGWPLAVGNSSSANGERPTANSRWVYPKSRNNKSSLRVASSMDAFHDQVENPIGHHDLRRALDLGRRPIARDDKHFVLIGVEPDRSVGDVVGHDQVGVLAQQL